MHARRWTLVDDGERTYAWATRASYGGDTGFLHHYLHGFACGEIRLVHDLGGQMDPCCGPPETYALEKGAARGALKLVHTEVGESSETTLRFDPARCRMFEE